MNSESPSQRLILASSSKYRQLLLQRLGIAFDCQVPDIDESAEKGELPHDLVIRLATRKAEIVALEKPQAIVIGSDQIAVFDGQIVGKPGRHDIALNQLLAFSGQRVDFLTSVTVKCQESGFFENYTDRTQVHFRTLQREELERYLRLETPYDCAGAFKAESLGIVLFDKITNDDPTALIGLPLIKLAAMLRKAGLRLP
jgi:septum formation protein